MQDRHNTKFHSKAVANKLGLDAKLTYKILKQCVKKTEAIIRKGDDVITDNVTFCLLKTATIKYYKTKQQNDKRKREPGKPEEHLQSPL